jgi:hypothetical protein
MKKSKYPREFIQQENSGHHLKKYSHSTRLIVVICLCLYL